MIRTYTRFFFFFNDTATTEIYTLSLHDALPIWDRVLSINLTGAFLCARAVGRDMIARGTQGRIINIASVLGHVGPDRKSTRLNSSHANISYAVFCLKKKKITYFVLPILIT